MPLHFFSIIKTKTLPFRRDQYFAQLRGFLVIFRQRKVSASEVVLQLNDTIFFIQQGFKAFFNYLKKQDYLDLYPCMYVYVCMNVCTVYISHSHKKTTKHKHTHLEADLYTYIFTHKKFHSVHIISHSGKSQLRLRCKYSITRPL